MSNVRSEADEIRIEMAKIRSALHQDVREVVGGAAAATDFRSYLRKYPWLSIGLAFASGYLIVPRRRPQPVTTFITAAPVGSSPTMAAVGLAGTDAPPKRSWGLFRPLMWVAGALWPIALRAGQSYALNYVESMLASNRPVPTGPSPSGPGRPWSGPADPTRRGSADDRLRSMRDV